MKDTPTLAGITREYNALCAEIARLKKVEGGLVTLQRQHQTLVDDLLKLIEPEMCEFQSVSPYAFSDDPDAKPTHRCIKDRGHVEAGDQSHTMLGHEYAIREVLQRRLTEQKMQSG